MKIIYLANIRMPTEKAHGLQIMKTCEALAEKGVEVVLYVPSRRNAIHGDPFEYYGVKRTFAVRRLPSLDLNGLKPAKLAYALSQLSFAVAALLMIRMKRSDVIYARDEYTSSILSFFKRKIYFEIHDGRYNFFVKRALRACDGIVCVSRGLEDICSKRGVNGEKLAIVPNGADIEKFDISMSRIEARKKLGLPLDQTIALYAGHLYAWKGVDTLADAATRLSPRARVVFVGGTDADIKSFSKRHAGDPGISVLGRKPFAEMPLYMRAADALILPNSASADVSELYTSPVKLFEYMAAGKPIVASDLPSIREIVDESTAMLVKPDDASDLARGIGAVFADANLARGLSERSRAEASKYAWSARAERIMGFIEKGMTKDPIRRERAFYDAESGSYSKKRYPRSSSDYVHSFYHQRLDIVREYVRRALGDLRASPAPAMLEVGCADGVVISSLRKEFGPAFSSYTGIDVSPDMIDAAKRAHSGEGIEFMLRDPEKCFGSSADVVIEVGVLNYTDVEREISCAHSILPTGGIYICSIAGSGSLWDKHRSAETGYSHFKRYDEYESMFDGFDILDAKPVGLHIRGIWRVPALARTIQRLSERAVGPFLPHLFHEKVYALRRKADPS